MTVAAEGDYIGVWDLTAESAHPTGITTDGTNIWVVDTDEYAVYKYNMTGGYIGHWHLTGVSTEPSGIATDGINIWVVDNNDNAVYKYNMTGGYIGVWYLTGVNIAPRGITTDGTNIWVVDNDEYSCYKYNMTGGYIGVWIFEVPEYTDLHGITTDGTNIWVVDNYAAAVYTYNMTGGYIGVWYLTAESTSPYGITTDGTNIWAVDNLGDAVYKYDALSPPTITSATNIDMDDDDNWYAMRKFYSSVVVVNDTDGATDIDKVFLQIKNATGVVVGEFRATNLTGTPAWAIQSGATVFDLDAASCSWAENGNEGTATFKIRVEWDITPGAGMTLEVYVEDLGGGYASFTEMQTDYVDLINRLVTTDFISNMTSARIDSPIQISGKVRYATTTDGDAASLFYPPHEEFTSVTIENDEEEIESIDTTITNGVFNVTFNSHTLVRTTYYYASLDLLDDYVDGFAPDGDFVIVTTSTGFYLSWLIDRAFNFFGIGNYLSQIYEYGSALGTYFATSIANLLQLIVQQFRIAFGVFGFFIDWYTRMVNLFFQMGAIIGGLLDGTGDVTSGLGNLWTYFSVNTWIDIMPLVLFIWWIDSIGSRGRTQGEFTVIMGDIGTVMNITSWFMSMFGLVVNTMTDLAFRLMEVIT